MGGIKRVIGIAFIWCVTVVGWLVLGAITEKRTGETNTKLEQGVQSLWGAPQVQAAPDLTFTWETQKLVERAEEKNGVVTQVRELVTETRAKSLLPDSTRVDVDLRSDLRRKGLLWFPLYDVQLGARYRYKHGEPTDGTLAVHFRFPDRNAIYDAFHLTVNGVDYAGAVDAAQGSITANVPVAVGQVLDIRFGYKSRGMSVWTYQPSASVARLSDFELNMRTHFHDIDFPTQSLSPSARERTSDGYQLRWRFDQVVSGFGIGMTVPSRIQPGELAAELAYSAPVSLFFYFLVIYVLATLRRIDLHPVNYFFIAGAFFAFHLLFAYTVNHLTVELAFAICSCVSVFLVVSYLRLVVSPAFALREAALAQIVYLIGFSLAHFWDGYTGLTVSVLAILTLFVLMQLTGRVRWSEVMSGAGPAAKTA